TTPFRRIPRRFSNVELFGLLRELPTGLISHAITNGAMASRDLDLIDGLDHMQRSAHQGVARPTMRPLQGPS
ncbi:MAG: hypothetical protein ACR2P3_07945, partial [Geminicoccaceae bacterium]